MLETSRVLPSWIRASSPCKFDSGVQGTAKPVTRVSHRAEAIGKTLRGISAARRDFGVGVAWHVSIGDVARWKIASRPILGERE